MKTNISVPERRARVFESLSVITQCLASPARLRIVQVLANRSSPVEKIAEILDESIANTSQHLQKLLKAGIVSCQKQGVSRVYRVANEEVIVTLLSLQNLAGQLDPQLREDELALCPPELVTDMEASDVMSEVENGRAVLVDVREISEFETTPVPGARHLPSSEIEKRFKELPKAKKIFLFCRGRYCALANPAVEFLRTKGYKAYRVREMSFQLKKLVKNH